MATNYEPTTVRCDDIVIQKPGVKDDIVFVWIDNKPVDYASDVYIHISKWGKLEVRVDDEIATNLVDRLKHSIELPAVAWFVGALSVFVAAVLCARYLGVTI